MQARFGSTGDVTGIASVIRRAQTVSVPQDCSERVQIARAIHLGRCSGQNVEPRHTSDLFFEPDRNFGRDLISSVAADQLAAGAFSDENDHV